MKYLVSIIAHKSWTTRDYHDLDGRIDDLVKFIGESPFFDIDDLKSRATQQGYEDISFQYETPARTEAMDLAFHLLKEMMVRLPYDQILWAREEWGDIVVVDEFDDNDDILCQYRWSVESQSWVLHGMR